MTESPEPATSSGPTLPEVRLTMAPPLPPPQIIVEELSGDDQYEDVGEAPSCDRLLNVDGTWLEQPPRRVRRSYRSKHEK
ncbi:hypothetical protein HPB51_012428 [Rhipicephalus microplus]|uniref:Uncharacterized protein n=1 Tax=Rhipicephalus microplus TaxID=6941 RepID=A0A9J6EA29_RHIMP|nr:hypothetical protein HPB51_012428 [Rhipicephalus microplus]